ncbi:MAG: DUF4159 domain-containing protein [Pseudomonadota bacterium]
MPALGPLSFLSPLLLLGLLALPLLWLLLRTTPPQPDRVRFPAFVILRRLTRVDETPDKTPWWLIALRLLLAAFVIIGLAGPILNAPPIEENTGPLVLVVDDSFAAAPAWAQREAVIEQAAAQNRQTGRPIFIMTTAPGLVPAAERVRGPLDQPALKALAGQLSPSPFRANRETIGTLINALDAMPAFQNAAGAPTFWWLADGLASPQGPGTDDQFISALRARGALTIYNDPQTTLLAVAPDISPAADAPRQGLSSLTYRIHRRSLRGRLTPTLVATARDGRELSRTPVTLGEGEKSVSVEISLPLALQNDLASVRLDGARTASAVWLADARDRRALIGLNASSREQSAALLSGNHYIRQAMAPFAAFQTGDILSLIEAQVSAIVLDDLGRLRAEEEKALTAWVDAGGVLIRFAGPRLADAALDGRPALLPVQLRRGERALGGTLTWGTPQPLGPFTGTGPFEGLEPPDDVVVRQQILAEPGGETSARTWASLVDGTPLVTGSAQGQGVIVLFHITATPLWSDLPLAEIFIQMLKKLTFLSALSPDSLDDQLNTGEAVRYPPLRLLDGYGQFIPASGSVSALTITAPEDTTINANAGIFTPTPQTPPGLYGSAEAPLAINTVQPGEDLAPLRVPADVTRPYAENPPRSLAPSFFVLALIALLLDLLATLFLKGTLFNRSAGTRSSDGVAAGLVALVLTGSLSLALALVTPPAAAQQPATRGATDKARPLDLPIDPRTAEATLTTRFAYVRTGNSTTDRLAEAGLRALSQELSRRTTVSPALPVGIDLSQDDFSVYPVLYWPVEPGMETVSDATLASVENFMRLGGLIIFDTRDEDAAVAGIETPAAATLRQILTRIDVPPLTPLPRDHVLTRSYYLLPDLRGRSAENPVWVAAGSAINDGVTPLIIGGRDWIGAWARDSRGQPLRPVAPGQRYSGPRAREMAFRAGINMMMVAFTGNYKTDQVHTDILLRRLGE